MISSSFKVLQFTINTPRPDFSSVPLLSYFLLNRSLPPYSPHSLSCSSEDTESTNQIIGAVPSRRRSLARFFIHLLAVSIALPDSSFLGFVRSTTLTNFILTVAGVSAVVLLLRSDVKQSATIFRRNVKHIRKWLEEESKVVPKELETKVPPKDIPKEDKH
ncbi:hypothetical protein M0R45_001607 [Rubus argutus]|uniref:Transmembrane protein n=1 Tax=Rubus argutus TaxID=59490 RepID=A0AAW1VJL6_RUBAR